MAKRPRPYIPLSVRVEVAEREVQKGLWWPLYCSAVEVGGMTLGTRLAILLEHLKQDFGGDVPQLDHDPALILRPYVDGYYSPAANDPAYLTYRASRKHLEKTTGRKHDAEKTVTTKGSDIWLKSKFNRLEGRTKQRPKAKIPSRKNPWPKGRKLQAKRSRP